MAKDDLTYRLFEDAIAIAKSKGIYRAKLGNGHSELYVLDDTGAWLAPLVWARIDFPTGTAVRAVRCRHTSIKYDLPVYVGPGPDGETEVLDVEPNLAPSVTGRFLNAATGAHAWTHGVFGGDALEIDTRLIVPLGVFPTDPRSLSVEVKPGQYALLGAYRYFAGDTVDLTSYLPTSAYHKAVVVCINRASEQIVIVEGPEYIPAVGATRANIPFSGKDIADIDVGDHKRLAAVRLFNGQTEVDWYDIPIDLRWNSSDPPSSTSMGYDPVDDTDWESVPETLASALDELADRITELETSGTGGGDDVLLWMTMR